MINDKETQQKPKGLGKDGKFPGPGPGRPKGSKDSITKQMVADVFATYEKLGGKDYLAQLAVSKHKSDRQLWSAICAKLMPAKIESDVSGSLTIDGLISAFDKDSNE